MRCGTACWNRFVELKVLLAVKKHHWVEIWQKVSKLNILYHTIKRRNNTKRRKALELIAYFVNKVEVCTFGTNTKCIHNHISVHVFKCTWFKFSISCCLNIHFTRLSFYIFKVVLNSRETILTKIIKRKCMISNEEG